MKTLNLNKLTILLGLFLVSAFFTTGANAGCVVNADGEIVTTYGNANPVKDALARPDIAANALNNTCNITPAEYKLVFYKYGICKADPDLGDLSSCAMLFEFAAGIEHDIELGVAEVLPIPEFAIEPGSYPYTYVLLSNKLGMKWSGTFDAVTEGWQGTDGTDGKNCWTAGRGPSAGSYQDSNGAAVVTVHGTTLTINAKTIQCNPTMGTPEFNYEIMTRFITEDADDNDIHCDADLLANGDYIEFEDIEGVGQGRGTPTVSLLTAADVFATTCQTAAKIAWTTDLITPLTITENSTFEMLMLATDSNELGFDTSVNNDIIQTMSGAPKIMLQVTN